jgi:hypothetical protein
MDAVRSVSVRQQGFRSQVASSSPRNLASTVGTRSLNGPRRVNRPPGHPASPRTPRPFSIDASSYGARRRSPAGGAPSAELLIEGGVPWGSSRRETLSGSHHASIPGATRGRSPKRWTDPLAGRGHALMAWAQSQSRQCDSVLGVIVRRFSHSEPTVVRAAQSATKQLRLTLNLPQGSRFSDRGDPECLLL